MSFRTRLVLAAAYLVAAVVLALEIPLALSIERRADSDFQTDVLGRAALLAATSSEMRAATNQGAPNTSTGALIQAVDDAAAAVDERIVVTNDRGHLLVDSAGRLVKRDDLVSEVWDANWFGSTKTLDVHVSSLRKKLGDDPAAPRYIHTVRGVGFRFSSADELQP